MDTTEQSPTPASPEDCPINELLNARLVNMTDDELEAFITQTRAAVETPQILKKLCSLKSTAKPKAKAKIDISMLIAGL